MRYTLKIGDYLFMLIGCLLQIVVAIITQSPILALISGVCGIISVVQCSQRNICFYFWGFIQLFTYVYLCMQQHFYGEILENVFYFVTMLVGIYIWYKNKDGETVNTRQLSKIANIIIGAACFVFIFIVWLVLIKTNDTQPFMDSISTVPAIIAQILMILRYREQWVYWLIIDVASIIMWVIADNWCMATQFIFWTINCIYGYKLWGR